MKTIQAKIRGPFLLLLISLPLATLVAFNIAIGIYLDQSASGQLQTVAKTLQTTIKLPANQGELTTANLDSVIVKLRQALRASKANASIDLLVFNRRGDLSYPRNIENSAFLNDDLVDKILQKVPGLQKNKVVHVRSGMEQYYLLAYPVANFAGEKPTIVFVEYMAGADELVGTMNLILICALVTGVLVAVFAGNRLSARIAYPVRTLSEWTKKIGAGHFEPLDRPAGANDILELHTLRQSIGEMAEQLAAYDRTQKTFLQNASHELKTPLMSIQGYAEGITKGIVSDVPGAAAIIENESKRLNALVDELLTLSRIESHTYTRELVRINLADALKEYVQRLGGLAAKQGRKLSVEAPDGPLYVLADDNLLSQMVLNIASNSLRYAKSEVVIKLTEAGLNAVVHIRDDGEGINPADLPYIFERFYKGRNGNFGLGLAIARSAAQLLGGTVRAENGNPGAVFELTFPKII